MTTEQWAWIPGYEGSYLISSRGRYWSVPRKVLRRNGVPMTVRGRIMRQTLNPRTGQFQVTLARQGRYQCVYTHRLLRDVFGDKATAA